MNSTRFTVVGLARRHKAHLRVPLRVAASSCVFAFVLAALSGCGGFDNAPWEPRPSAPIPEPTPDVTPPEKMASHVATLALRSAQGGLPAARYGLPYAYQFRLLGDARPASVCWRLKDGALPPGLVVNSQTGLLSGRVSESASGVSLFRVEAFSPCQGAEHTAVGASDWLSIAMTGRCTWDLDCSVGEACRQDGTCRADVGASCPRAVGPALRFDVLSGVGHGSEGPQSFTLNNMVVVSNDFPRFEGGEIAPRQTNSACGASDHVLVIEQAQSREQHSFCYRLPGELRVPVSAGALVDLAFYAGALGERAVFVRDRSGPSVASTWSWSAYSGHADPAAAVDSLCTSKGFCPLLTSAEPVVASGCRIDGACDPVMAGLRLPSQAQVRWPGQLAPWGQTPEGKPLYTALLARGWSEERCEHRALSAGFSYLMLAGFAPHPLMELESTDVVLDQIPRWVEVDGTPSVPVAQAAGGGSYLDAYFWEVQGPPHHPRIQLAADEPHPSFPAYLAGTYTVRLAVRDSKSKLTSPAETEARVVVRPKDALHVEVVWDDELADVNLIVLPPTALLDGAEPKMAWDEQLRDGASPSWAQAAGQQLAEIHAQPDGHRLEVARVAAAVAALGPMGLALDQSARSDAEAVQVSVRIYAYGQRVDGGQFENIALQPNAILPLGRVSAADAAILPW